MNSKNFSSSNLANVVATVKKFFRQELLPLLADLRLAILLLLAIAAFSITGTVIEQGQSIPYYQSNYPEHPALFGFLTWKVIIILGLDRVYRTWWFIAPVKINFHWLKRQVRSQRFRSFLAFAIPLKSR